MKLKRIAIFALATLFYSASAIAYDAARTIVQEFGIETHYVTRKDSNLYEVSLSDAIIKTRYCYEYAYSEEVVVTKRKLIFLDNDAVCDIEGIYAKQ
jgi:hypothetical protein